MVVSKEEFVKLHQIFFLKKFSLQLLTTHINKNPPKTFMGILKFLYSSKQLEGSIKLGVEDFNILKSNNNNLLFSLY